MDTLTCCLNKFSAFCVRSRQIPVIYSASCRTEQKMLLHFSAGVVIEKPNVSWDEIKGCDDAKETLKERVVLPGKFPLLFPRRALHGGILLFGVS